MYIVPHVKIVHLIKIKFVTEDVGMLLSREAYINLSLFIIISVIKTLKNVSMLVSNQYSMDM